MGSCWWVEYQVGGHLILVTLAHLVRLCNHFLHESLPQFQFSAQNVTHSCETF